ncbi:MAG: hypothetical protein UV80_C0006G0037 [Candidatus Peregrinibacteria bacterium GW2011_GWF2_43_17]|nr:MAG: hypothetical protein UV80_C0006G0037 [Candidatus Peregrinibacteria bacterium GW2011_GWF2_43_17]KKT19561.1 MAG: hypothetical protein UW03_C0016G0018 [Candidatus Peregrinibacteria bacterium GW2011_GWA2_43_8]HAU39993.1 hypothetical protein [Candidatus Peregrinibacteria bacterium]
MKDTYYTEDIVEATTLLTMNFPFAGYEKAKDGSRRGKFNFSTNGIEQEFSDTIKKYTRRELVCDPIDVINNYSFLRDLTRKHNG